MSTFVAGTKRARGVEFLVDRAKGRSLVKEAANAQIVSPHRGCADCVCRWCTGHVDRRFIHTGAHVDVPVSIFYRGSGVVRG